MVKPGRGPPSLCVLRVEIEVSLKSLRGLDMFYSRKVNILVGPSRKPDEATASDDAGSNGGGDSSHDVHSGVEVQEKEDGGHAVGGESDDEVDDTVLEEEGPEIGATRSPDETNGGHRQDEEIVTHGWKSFCFR